ncbi:MAG TPA: hypothetical protein VMB75_06940 [Rhodocyclaceae bacterium]|nr:hypothetical protein [Rhodocyclaceae bacterium]
MKYAALILLAAAAPLFAQDKPQFISDEEKSELQGKARAMRDEAGAIRAKANQDYEAAAKACWQKFLVTSCQEDARAVQRKANDRAKQLDHDAREIEHDVKVRDVATKEAKRIEEEPRRQAEAAAQAEKNRREQEEALRRIREKQAEREARESQQKPPGQ